MDEVGHCGIYVAGVADTGALAALIEAAVDGRLDGFSAIPNGTRSVISKDGIEIDVGTNSTNPRFEAVPPDPSNWLFWPYIIDLDVDEHRGVPLVRSILRQLWSNGVLAVAACDFEDQLPRSGGYDAERLILTDD